MNSYPMRSTAAGASKSFPRPQPGEGTNLTSNSLGFSTGATPAANTYRHPFRVSLAGNGYARVALGLVELLEPTVDGKPLREKAIKLDPSAIDVDGASWICVDVEPDESGRLTKETPVMIVQASDPQFFTPEKGRCPLAKLLWQGRKPLSVHQVVHFNLRYFRLKEATVTRHLFY